MPSAPTHFPQAQLLLFSEDTPAPIAANSRQDQPRSALHGSSGRPKPPATTTALPRPASRSAPAVLTPVAYVAAERVERLEVFVRVQLLMAVAHAAQAEAAVLEAMLPNPVYDHPVSLSPEALAQGAHDVLAAPTVQQAVALIAYTAAVPDEQIPDELPASVAQKQSSASTGASASTPAPSSTTLLAGDQFGVDGRQLGWPDSFPPYPKALQKTQRSAICPLVIIIGTRQRPYELPRIALARVVYSTEKTVRVQLFDESRSERTLMQDAVWCVPSADKLSQFVARYTAFQKALTAEADVLRSLGSYSSRLREACGTGDNRPRAADVERLGKQRLCETVVCADDPDDRGSWISFEPFKVGDVTRKAIARHTPTMLAFAVGSGGLQNQRNTFICRDDNDWTLVEDAHAETAIGQQALLDFLQELGTYDVALTDKRYQSLVIPTTLPPLPLFDQLL